MGAPSKILQRCDGGVTAAQMRDFGGFGAVGPQDRKREKRALHDPILTQQRPLASSARHTSPDSTLERHDLHTVAGGAKPVPFIKLNSLSHFARSILQGVYFDIILSREADASDATRARRDTRCGEREKVMRGRIVSAMSRGYPACRTQVVAYPLNNHPRTHPDSREAVANVQQGGAVDREACDM